MFLARLPIPALLAKELIELAAKPRTYVIRGLYALALLALFLATSAGDIMALSNGNLQVLGAGQHLFQDLVIWQFGALYLFLPVLIAPLVSEDEERGNLDILIVSGIGPGEFLLQKMLSRLVGMGTLMLLALPLGGIAYCLGGVDSEMIIAAAISLMMACVQIGCWAIWCSAREATTFGAVRRAYVQGFFWLLLAPALLSIPLWFIGLVIRALTWHSPFDEYLNKWLAPQSFFPFSLYTWATSNHVPAWRILANSLLLLGSSVWAFWAAVRAMRIRSTTMSAQMMKQMKIYRNEFRFERRRRAQVIKSGRDLEALPTDRALSWREQRRMWLLRIWGQALHSGIWVKSVLAGLISLLVWLCFTIESRLHHFQWLNEKTWDFYNSLATGELMLAIPALAISAAGLFAGERSRRSLELLLILPMGTSAILAEKIAGCGALSWIFLGVVMIPIVGQGMAEIPSDLPWSAVLHVPLAGLICWIYLRLAIWLSLAISLRVRSQVHATIIVLAIIIAWCVLPMIVQSLINHLNTLPSPSLRFALFLVSPVSVFDEILTADFIWCGRVAAFIVSYGGILWLLRWHTRRQADALLGRLA